MKDPSHILVIRLSALGDVAMTVPVLRKMAETYPQLKFTVLTRKFFAPLFEDLPQVQVFEADVKKKHKGIHGLRKLSKELIAKDIDAVADLHNVLRSKILKRFFMFYGLPVKQLNKGRAEKRALTRKDHRIFKQLKSSHQRYADVFSALGYSIDLDDYVFPPKKTLSPEIRKITGREPKKWLGIAPFAQHKAKMYPQDLMEKVLNRLEASDKMKVFLFGAGNEEAKILANWEEKFSNVTSMAGKVAFQEELALISNLDTMVSMDSGNGHIAANFGIPVITLWGLTHPFTGFAPFAQPESNFLLPDLKKYPRIPTSIYGKHVPPGYGEAMRSISPDSVVQKIEEVLKL